MAVVIMASLAILMLAGTALAEHGSIIIKDTKAGVFEHGTIDPK